ncbi:sugar phosphate nucleotidyltransferase [Candidatus Parvarchaeota archaeon]|nr:sugar phosphate nucleotidyltransferase [Candidatus Parvarchaeota archaeon]
MQTLILAAGESSRFWPFSEICHKSLLKVGNKTLLEQTIDGVKDNEVIIIVNPKTKLSDEVTKNKRIKIVIQEEPKGMADAIIKAKPEIKDDFLVIMPYYVNIKDYIQKLSKVKAPAVAVKKYEDGDEKTHGIARIEKNKIIEIREKEKFDYAGYSIVGIYKLNKEIINRLEKIQNPEYTFEDLLNEIAKTNGLNYFEADNLPSLKYVSDLLSIKRFVYSNIKQKKRSESPAKKNNVFIETSVVIGKNVKIGNNVSIKGETYIGDNSFIGDNALIRDSIIGENTEIGFGTEIARSIVMDNTHIHSGFVGDSIIGQNCRLGANFITGNRRIDRKSIRIEIKEGYDTGLTRLGVIMGYNVKTGINTSVMPGTLVGNNSIIGSNTEIKGRIESNKLVYSKKENTEKDI